MNGLENLHKFIHDLVVEAEAVILTQNFIRSGALANAWVNLESFSKLRAKCALLSAMLPVYPNPWKRQLEADVNNLLSHAVSTLGMLKTIQEGMDAGLLVRLEDFVFAEAFSNFLDQARHLLDQGYLLPAGVLGRAVLEERLNRLCAANNCSPVKTLPTINDYNTELYKSTVYDKSQFMHVGAMASVGNDAAHGKLIDKEDAKRLLRDVEDFLSRFSA